MLQRALKLTLTNQVLHLLGEYLAFSLLVKGKQDHQGTAQLPSTRGAADEDGDHGSLTEPTREGPWGSPEGLVHGLHRPGGPKHGAQGKCIED